MVFSNKGFDVQMLEHLFLKVPRFSGRENSVYFIERRDEDCIYKKKTSGDKRRVQVYDVKL